MSMQDDRARSLVPERGVVKPRQLAHVVRRTSRFEELVQWYCTVLGAEVVPSSKAIDAWMRSGEFAANPIGMVFDPAELLACYRAGEPLTTLTARPPLPQGANPFDMLRF